MSERENFWADKSLQNKSKLEYFKSSVQSLNVNQLSSDLIELNSTKISHQLNSFSDCHSIEIENDSGFNSPSMSSSPNFNFDSRSHYKFEFDCEPKFQLQSLSSFSIANNSISYAPFIFKDTLNNSLNGIKKSIIGSKLAHFVRRKFFSKDLFSVLQQSPKSISDVSIENSNSKESSQSKSSQFYNTGINTFRQILLRIYDVNYF